MRLTKIRKIKKLSDCLTIEDLRELSFKRLPAPIFHFLDGAGFSEVTAEQNITAFDKVKLIHKSLVDVSNVDTSCTILGQKIEWPVYCGPTGLSRLFDKEGELAVVRAAAKMGTAYVASTASSFTFDDMALASESPKILQLCIFKDRGLSLEMIEQARAAGYKAICLTVDMPVSGHRLRDLRTGMTMPLSLTPKSKIDFIRHPGWCWDLVSGGAITMASLMDKVGGSKDIAVTAKFLHSQLDPSVSWDDVRPLIEAWGGPFTIKGILSVGDARRAVNTGAGTIIVSNHGGRQFDGGATPIEMLPKIVDAVGDQIEIILDGGVRNGFHVLKALALGAKACSIGRAPVYGLGAGGQAGVEKALTILRTEIQTGMALMGCPSVKDIDRSFVVDM